MPQAGGSRHAIEPPTIDSGCAGLACDVNVMLAVLVTLGALTLGAVAFLRVVREAQTYCDLERDRLLEECEAFLEFADRVTQIQVAPRPDGGRPVHGPLMSDSGGKGLSQVEDAYRDTVMSISHFESDYDESLEEHMATELSPELASAVVDGTQLTPAIRNPLVASARSAAHDRRVLAEELSEEYADLEDAEESLDRLTSRFEETDGDGLVKRTFPDLQARWRRLNEIQDDCRSLLDRRQSQLRSRMPDSGTRLQSPTAVSEYLYGDMDVDFPVLASGTRVLERIEEEKRHTVQALTERRR